VTFEIPRRNARNTDAVLWDLPVWSVGLILSCLISIVVARWIRAVPYDDPFITFRYAANLRDGFGLVFNPDEALLSTTTPLLALLLGGLGALFPGQDIAQLGYWFSFVALAFAGGLACIVCWLEGERVAALLAPFAVVLTPSFIRGVGQEMSLVLALGLAGFYFWRQRRLKLAAIMLGLLTLTRPDGVLFAFVLLLAEVRRSSGLPFRAGMMFVIVIMPWYSYAWLTYGSPFPFSLAAKIAQAETGWWPTTGFGVIAWGRDLIDSFPLKAALAGLGIAYATIRARWALLMLAWPVLQLLGYAVLGVAFYAWYAAPLDGVLSLFAALGGGMVARMTGKVKYCSFPATAVVFSLVALAIIVPGVQYTRLEGRNVPDAKMRQYETIGLWLQQHVPPESQFAALELGRLGYFSQRPMFDFVGLVRPSVIAHLRQKDLMWSIKTYLPDYVVAIPPDRWLFEDEWFNRTYSPIREFVDSSVYQGQPVVLFLRSVGNPPALTRVQTTSHRFGDSIELIGHTLDAPPVSADGTIGLILHWRALHQIDRDLSVYVHALDQDGLIVGQADGQPVGGRWATSRWFPGDIILDTRKILVEPAGTVHRLQIGWYSLESLERLPGIGQDGQNAESVIINLPSNP
jgi:hypothetical protein